MASTDSALGRAPGAGGLGIPGAPGAADRLRTLAANAVRTAQSIREASASRTLISVLSAVTPTGWTVLAASLAAWLGSGRLRWSELRLIAVMGLVVFVLCCGMALGRSSLRVALRLSAQRITVSGSCRVTVEVHEPVERRRFNLVPARLRVPDGSEAGRTFDLPVLGRGMAHRFPPFDVPGDRRGVIALGPATAVRGDPFGLVRRRLVLAEEQELLVHPLRIALPPLGSGVLHDLEGRVTEHVSASDLEFHTLREYLPSDDARHIHWRSSAKISSARPDKPFLVRRFLETRLTHLLVLVDGEQASYTDPEQFETAVSAGASIAERALRDKLQVTLLVADRLAHEPSIPQALDACARADLAAGAGLFALIARGLRVAPRTTSVMIITGSVRDYPELRRVCRRIPRGLRSVAIRVDPDNPTGVTASGALSALSLRRIEDLPVLIREAVSA
jgi:uncharacterized protein (DUF58 family)